MCRQLFSQSIMLKDHIETHKNENGTFSCPYCQRIFIKYSVIRKHIRAHHCERKHKCQICAKRFATVDKLQMHLLKHSDHRYSKIYIGYKRLCNFYYNITFFIFTENFTVQIAENNLREKTN